MLQDYFVRVDFALQDHLDFSSHSFTMSFHLHPGFNSDLAKDVAVKTCKFKNRLTDDDIMNVVAYWATPQLLSWELIGKFINNGFVQDFQKGGYTAYFEPIYLLGEHTDYSVYVSTPSGMAYTPILNHDDQENGNPIWWRYQCHQFINYQMKRNGQLSMGVI